MLTKCICTNCAGHLEFEEENAGEQINCPHCGFQTTLFLPGTGPGEEEIAALARKITMRRWLIRIGAGLLITAAVIFALWKLCLPLVQDLLPATQNRFVLWLVLLVCCFAIPFLLFWLVFPVLLWLQMRQLTNFIEQLAENTRPAPELVEAVPEPEPEETTDSSETVNADEPNGPA